MTESKERSSLIRGFFEEKKELHGKWLESAHRLAEPAFEEHETCKFIKGILGEYCPGFEVCSPFPLAPTAVVACFVPQTERKKAILLRADMDALRMKGAPIEGGRMNEELHHGCGHEGHVTCLLAAAHCLSTFPDLMERKVVLLFQPAEEAGKVGIGSGATACVKSGLFESIHEDVSAVYAVHCWPGLEIGDVGVGGGAMMGASGSFRFVIRGGGGHAATPGAGRSEPLLAACAIVSSGQVVVSRLTSAFEPAVVAFTGVENIDAQSTNVCPAVVGVRGTIRSMSDEVRKNVEEQLGRMVEHIAAGYGCTAEVGFKRGYPATVNSVDCAAVAREAGVRVHGGEDGMHEVGNGVGEMRPSMCSEDFSVLLQQRPGAYVWLGNGRESAGLHTGDLKFRVEAVRYGAQLFTELATGRDCTDVVC